MRRYTFTKDFGFIQKGRSLLQTTSGDFVLQMTDDECVGGALPWCGTVVLRNDYVLGLVKKRTLVRAPLDRLFDTLSANTLNFIEDQLTNNESSGDEELAGHFVGCGISPEQAARALTYRNAYLLGMFALGDGPMFGGADIRPQLPRL